MNKVMLITALAASLLASAAAVAAPTAFSDAIAPEGAVTLVRGGGGGGNGHIGNLGSPTGGPGGAHFEANGHLENYHLGQANSGRWHNNRFYPGGLFVYGGDYGSVYAGGCGWLRREANATGSHYWWRRYQECLYG